MDIGPLLHEHIYPAIVLGSLIEGETTVVLAGYATHQGYASFWAVTALAACVTYLLDLAWYLLGRSRGPQLMARFAALRRGVEIISPRLHSHHRRIIFLVRFMYGLRTAGPIALGIARVPWQDFVIVSALGAVVWAVTFTALGYAFGRALAVLLSELAHYEAVAVGVIAMGGLVAWLWRRHLKRRKGR